jgi:hypothetical protein
MDKAQWALNLLKDDMYIEMMENLKAIELNKFATSAPDEIKVREQAYYRLASLDLVSSYLESMAAQKLIDAKKLKIL